MINIIYWLLATIAVEAIVEIVIASELFSPLHFWLFKKSENNRVIGFVNKLMSCGYCFSVWVAAGVAWMLPGSPSGIAVVDTILKIFVLHRLSNLIHELFKRWLDRIPFNVVITNIHDIESFPDIKITDETLKRNGTLKSTTITKE